MQSLRLGWQVLAESYFRPKRFRFGVRKSLEIFFRLSRARDHCGETDALGGDDIRELQKAGVPVVSLRQDGLDYFDVHHTADDTLDKIDPKQLDQAIAVWPAFHLSCRSIGRGFQEPRTKAK
jgi:Peptidase family M28